MPTSPVYLDHAATTPVRPEVLEAMLPYLGEAAFGNPSSAHRFGRAARAGLEEARRQVAEAVEAEPNQVVFTSGGTEADNLAIIGCCLAARDHGSPDAGGGLRHRAQGDPRLGPRGLPPGRPRDRPPGRRQRRGRPRRPRSGAGRAAGGGLGDVGQQRGRDDAAAGGDRGPMSGRGRDAAQRRRPGLRQDSRLLPFPSMAPC